MSKRRIADNSMRNKPTKSFDLDLVFQRANLKFILLIVIAALAVYANSILNGFVFDDNNQILENRWIRDFSFISDIFTTNVAGFGSGYATSYYRPMMHVIYLFVYQVFGLNAWAYHLVNVLFHTGVCILVFLIASKLFQPNDSSERASWLSPAFMAALLFTTHPVHTEAVAWVAAVPELSFTFFYLLAFYLYMHSHRNDKLTDNTAYVVSIASFFVATLCKEPALTLPIILVIYDHLNGKMIKSRPLETLKRYAPYFIVAVIYLILRFNALGGFTPSVKHSLSLYQFFLNIFSLFALYMGKILLPVNLSAFHVFHPVTGLFETRAVLSVVASLIFLILAIVSYKKNKAIFFFLVLFFVPLLPALYIPGLGENAFAERQVYLPSLGFVLLFSLSLSLIAGSKRSLFVSLLFALMISLYSIGTVSRNTVWKEEHSLWSDAVKKAPHSGTAHGYLGYALYSKGRIDEAIAHYRKSIELNPNLIDSHINLGIAYYAQKSYDAAIEQFVIALRLNTGSIDARINLADALAVKGLTFQALEHYQLALQIDPSSARSHSGLGILFGNAGQYKQAVNHFQRAVQLEPGNVNYRTYLDKAYSLQSAKNYR